MKERIMPMLVVAAALVLCLVFGVAATGSTELILELSPQTQQAQPGAEITVILSVAQNPGFSQAQVQLDFDPDVLQLVSYSLEESVFDTGVMTVDTETAGALLVSIGLLPGEENEPVHTATGHLLAVTFRVAEDFTGETALSATASSEDGILVQSGSCTVGSAAPHVHTEEEIPMVRATCTEPGWTEGVRCAECGEILVAPQYIVPNGHNPGESVAENLVPTSCQSDGSYEEVVYCRICNAELSRETVVIPTNGEHNYIVEQESVAPTCTEDGYAVMACACGETQDVTLPATGHKEETDAPRSATCTEDGLTEGSHCAVCQAVLVAQETIPALGHAEESLAGYAATCTSPGLTDGVVCSRCNTTMVAQQEIPATGHTQIQVAAVAATCSAAGHTAGVKCSVCAQILSGCETVAKLPHTEAVLHGEEPTCSQPGKTEGRYCTVCGYVTLAQREIPPTEHTPIVIAAEEATCSKTGWTEGSRCSVCNEILVSPVEIAKVDHRAEIIPGTPATCSQAGLTDGQRCGMCGMLLQEQTPIAQLEHSYDYGCDAACKVCGAANPSIRHTFSEWVVLKEATTEEAGEQRRTCLHCGYVETQTMAQLISGSSDRMLSIGIAYVIMAGCVIVILTALRRNRLTPKEE